MAMVGFRLGPRRPDEVGDVLVFLHESRFEMQGRAGLAQRLVRGGDKLHGGEHLLA